MIEFVAGLLAYAVAWMMVPALRKAALKWRFVDLPNERKIHRDPLPLLGGAAMLASFLISATLFSAFHGGLHETYLGLVSGSLLLFAIGLLDDYFKTRGKDFPALPRLIAQILAAALVAVTGGVVRGFTVPFGHVHYVALPSAVSIFVTIVWIVGVVNVFNFLDGVDGLAAGIAAISAMTLFVIAMVKHDVSSALCAVSLAGAALGFLRHNFYPARIIMGDAGSTVLGFLLASIAVIGAFKSATIISVSVPILALGVPILDGIHVVIKRALAGKPVYKADKTHTHHQLLNAGLTQVQTVAFMYLLSVCLSLVAVIVVLLSH